MSCPDCPGCSLQIWLENQIETSTQTNTFSFDINYKCWKSNGFNKQLIARVIDSLKFNVENYNIEYKARKYIITLQLV